jgi:selenide,water dikinase
MTNKQNLVLIGGGHSHAIALKFFGKKPLPTINLTLISDTAQTPYSGMLPGHIAGYYTFEQTHIDLISLANFAKAELYLDRAIGLDLNKNQVLCTHHPPLDFDFLSIDIGSTPETSTVTGAAEYAIPAKPVGKLLQTWNRILETASNQPEERLTISIVGGGAGGVELALNMHSRLEKILTPQKLQIHLFQGGRQLLPFHNAWVRAKLAGVLQQRGIKLHLEAKVVEVLPHQVICESQLKVPSDYIFWVTQASAPDWIKTSGLTTDRRGFILVKDTLQSVSHPHIFAAGDIATMKNYPRPKAGVFAVRQGKPLWNNLRRMLTGKSLQAYIPQKQYLSLIGTGDQRAIASWGHVGWESPLLWSWKDYIDRQFMSGLKC